VNRLAHGLHALGVGAGDRVALLLHNGHEHVEVGAALGHLGALAVQVGYRLKPQEVAYLLRDSGARALFFHGRYAATVEEALALGCGLQKDACIIADPGAHPGAGFTSYEQLLERGDPEQPPHVSEGGYGGVLTYTSGTTGHVKGARRTFRDMGWGPLLNFLADLPMRHDERHLVVCPLYHSAGAFFSSVTLALGGALVLLDHFEPEPVLRTIERERITSAMMVPTMFNRLLDVGLPAIRRYDLSSLRWLVSGAAPLPTDLARRIEDTFGPLLYNFYGATETGTVTIARPGEHTARPGTIGRLVRGNHARLLDDSGREVGVGEVGELFVKNGMLVAGYHGNEQATRAAMRDGYFSVGDLARRDADGYYYLVDRKHDMVISGGVNVYPWEIEQRLHAHPAVSEAAVVGVPDADWGESLAAFVVLRDGAGATAEEIQSWVTAELADYKRPRRVLFVDALPRNPTGKVLKRELKARLAPA
jgi:fatty-acyl-CoA synthase